MNAGVHHPGRRRGRSALPSNRGVRSVCRAASSILAGLHPASVVLAVPVSSPESLPELRGEADAVVAVESPRGFRAVGRFYRRFGQVSDGEAMTYLDR